MRRSLLLCLAAVAATPAGAQLQPAPSGVPGSQAVNPQAVVAEVRRIIAARYVLPERRPALDAVLAQGLSSGRYNVTDPAILAERINADLERVGKDRHLNFSYNPQQAALASARRSESAPDSGGYERQVRARNHGVAELKLLPGNIRYLDYRGFDWIGMESQVAIYVAMQFLKEGDAVIIDLRRNGGGSPEAVQHMVSHFMEADRPLVTFYMNGEPSPDRLSTLRELPVGRSVGKPLYVLISGNTASAAEEFAGHVGGYKLGELVGENTAGAGFRNDVVPIAGGFMLSVSVGRAVLASTGKDWEAVGHAPTIKVPVAAALDTAQAHALRRLAAAAAPADKARLEGIADALAARSERRAAGLPLATYAGGYGERRVMVEGDRLFYQRGERPRQPLIALGGHRFAMENDPETVVEFAPAGSRVAAMIVGPAGGPAQGRYDRTEATAGTAPTR